MCVSERSLHPVFVAAKEPASFVGRFQTAVQSVLRRIGVPPESLDHEAREMAKVMTSATAKSRHCVTKMGRVLKRLATAEHYATIALLLGPILAWLSIALTFPREVQTSADNLVVPAENLSGRS